jgi:hypothetical protein
MYAPTVEKHRVTEVVSERDVTSGIVFSGQAEIGGRFREAIRSHRERHAAGYRDGLAETNEAGPSPSEEPKSLLSKARSHAEKSLEEATALIGVDYGERPLVIWKIVEGRVQREVGFCIPTEGGAETGLLTHGGHHAVIPDKGKLATEVEAGNIGLGPDRRSAETEEQVSYGDKRK